MKGIGLARMVYGLEFKLSADFTFQNSHVQTLTTNQFKKMFPFKITFRLEKENTSKKKDNYKKLQQSFLFHSLLKFFASKCSLAISNIKHLHIPNAPSGLLTNGQHLRRQKR